MGDVCCPWALSRVWGLRKFEKVGDGVVLFCLYIIVAGSPHSIGGISLNAARDQ